MQISGWVQNVTGMSPDWRCRTVDGVNVQGSRLREAFGCCAVAPEAYT